MTLWEKTEQFRRALGQPFAQYRRNSYLEWSVLMVGAFVLLVAIAESGWVLRSDSAVYDVAMSAGAAGKSVPSDIVIVAIDDASLSEIGRWPWRRVVLARLIDRIAADAPQVIGMDVILTEPDAQHPADDVALQASIAKAGNVVLPAVVESMQGAAVIHRPMAAFHARVGHINMLLDKDGVARHLYLRESVGSDPLPHFAAAVVGPPGGASGVPPYRVEPGSDVLRGNWRWQDKFRIPFAGPPGTVPTVPVADVLDGKIPAEAFRNKVVLIGATASGLGDVFPTPVSRNGEGMSGVEVIANTVQALRTGRGILTLPEVPFWMLSLLPVALAGLASLWLRPKYALLACAACCVGSLVLCVVLMVTLQRWFPPTAAVFVSALIYPLWSWRRQEAALRFLGDGLRQLEKEPGLLDLSPEVKEVGHDLDARMHAVFRLTTALRDMRRFLADGLEALTEPTLICDPTGRVLLLNRRMQQLAPSTLRHRNSSSVAELPNIRDIMQEIFESPDEGVAYWEALCRAGIGADQGAGNAMGQPTEIDLSTRTGQEVLLRGAPLHGDTGSVAGHIVTCIDITELRRAEHRREESLRFVSHDMRSPQASILALIDLQRTPRKALPMPQLLDRIGEYANRTLELADDFIQLARAEAPHWDFVETDIAGVVLDAADELWALAQSRQIRLNVDIEDRAFVARVEPMLLARAVANLVSNAIKFSSADSAVSIRLYSLASGYVIEVEDKGVGISPDDQQRLFKPFSRVQHGTHDRPSGVGLGLVFVKTVAERHGGSISLSSVAGEGATFRMTLPHSTLSCDMMP
ncbi:CHASE2 domain-containing protein [Pandoraea eparura]|nr:CHASE2 domain-containing protein [Pandoraea eparura]